MLTSLAAKRIGLIVVILLVLALVPTMVGPRSYSLDIFVRILLFVGLCSAWNIVGGIAGQLAFAHSVFIAAGAYSVAYFAREEWSPWLGMLLGACISVVLGAAIAWIAARFELQHLSFALITLAISELGLLVVMTMKPLGGPAGLSMPYGSETDLLMYRFATNFGHYWVALVLAVLSTGIGWLVWRSKLGYQFRCVKDNERAAAALGINVLSSKVVSMSLSAALTALLGGAYASYMSYVDPHFFAAPTLVIQIILFTAVGGMGTVWGPALGAIVFVPISDVLRTQFGGTLPPGSHVVFYGVFVILVILLARGGLVGVAEGAWSRLKRQRTRAESEATGPPNRHAERDLAPKPSAGGR